MEHLANIGDVENLFRMGYLEARRAVQAALRKWPDHLRGQDSVDEVMSDLALELVSSIKKRDRGRMPSDPAHAVFWLALIGRRCAIKFALRRARDASRETPLPEDGEIPALRDMDSVEAKLVEAVRENERREIRRELKKALRGLTSRDRGCVRAPYKRGKVKKVAHHLGMTELHVRVRAFNIRRQLRKRLLQGC
jgi:RNA polymerase sigma factor (sigma-70 family)